MQQVRVRILLPDDQDNVGAEYRSDDVEPRRLEIASPDRTSVGALYKAILDLPEGRDHYWPAEHLFVVGINLEAGHEEDFEDWYNTEHLPALAGVPGVNRATRFRLAERPTNGAEEYPAYLALYDIMHPEIAGNADWQAAVNTPWTISLRTHFQAIWRGGYRYEGERP